MFESIITVSLYPYAWVMGKHQPQSIEKEVIPFSAIPRHLLHSHYRHPLKKFVLYLFSPS